MKTRVIEKESSNQMAKEEVKKTPQNQGKINDGYDTVHDVDPVGYWDEESGPVYFIPRFARVFDGNIEKAKPAVLFFGHLTQASGLKVGKGEDSEQIVGKNGDFIAVWGKPGMGGIADKCDVPIKMYQEGEKDTSKPNPMKLYKVVTKGPDYVKKGFLPFKEDSRDYSFGVTTFLEPRTGKKQQQRSGTAPQGSGPSSDTNGDVDFDPIS